MARAIRPGRVAELAVFYPFALPGVPCSILGGVTHLPAFIYHPIVGALLLLAAWQMARSMRRTSAADSEAIKQPLLPAAVLAGAVIGFVAGVTGIAGGVLLAPLMLTLNWAGARQTTTVSAAFNLLNTAAALAGLWLSLHAFALPPSWWLLAVVCGGSFGSWLSVRALPTWAIQYGLAALLVVAGIRMLVSP